MKKQTVKSDKAAAVKPVGKKVEKDVKVTPVCMAGDIPVYCPGCEIKATDTLRPHPDNPNTHSKKQLNLIKIIISRNGWRSPIVISKRSGLIIKGHGRWMTAREQRWPFVPVQYQEYVNERQEYEDMIADNQLGELSTFDPTSLSRMVEAMKEGGDFTAGFIGFEANTLDKLLGKALGTDGAGRGERTQDEEDEEFGAIRTRMVHSLFYPSGITPQLGEWWRLGHNWLYVGSLQEDWRKVMKRAETLEKELKRHVQVVGNPSPYLLSEIENAIKTKYQPDIFKPCVATITEITIAGLAIDLFTAGFGQKNVRKEKA